MSKKLKLLVVDDHPIFLKGLVEVLRDELPNSEIEAFTSSSEALQSIENLAPDIAVLDLDMPIMNGLELSAALKSIVNDLKVIILTMHKESDIIRAIIAKGIDGYVVKDDAVIELVKAIELVLKGEKYISNPSMLQMNEESIQIIQSLTKTECLILRHIADKKASREIADLLFVSIKTVENHRYNISKKLQLKGSNSLLKFALENKSLI